MKVVFHHKNGQRDLKKWIGLFILSGVLVISVCWNPFSEQRFSVCLIRNLTGLSCPGCGMGRAFLFLGHGQILNAFDMNPVSLLAFPMILFFWINNVLSLVFKKEMKIQINTFEKGMVIGLAAGLTLGIWFYKFKM